MWSISRDIWNEIFLVKKKWNFFSKTKQKKKHLLYIWREKERINTHKHKKSYSDNTHFYLPFVLFYIAWIFYNRFLKCSLSQHYKKNVSRKIIILQHSMKTRWLHPYQTEAYAQEKDKNEHSLKGHIYGGCFSFLPFSPMLDNVVIILYKWN